MFGADSKYKGKDKAYDLHLTAEDFVDVGKDFCKSIFNANTSSILKRIFYPILEISPLDDSIL